MPTKKKKAKAPKRKAVRRQPTKKAATRKSSGRDILINVKVSKAQRDSMQRRADKFVRGNLSNWIRIAAVDHSPN